MGAGNGVGELPTAAELEGAPGPPPRLVLLSNSYIVHEPIGEGGASFVYRATNRVTRQTVALKLMRTRERTPSDRPVPEASGTRSGALDERLMLAREFQTLSSLHHPNVIRVFDYGFDEAAGPYFTMELLASPRDILTACREKPARGKIQLLVQLLRALVYVHRREVIHCDLKPSNILVVDDRVRVLDFGIALAKSARGHSAGTIGYMAPEVLLGQPPSVASDLFALGVIAYQLFCDRHPYDMSSASRFLRGILRQPVSEEDAEKPMIVWAYLLLGGAPDDGNREPTLGRPEPLSGLGKLTEPLDRIILKLLAPRPELRYSSAEAVIEDLGAAMDVRLVVDTTETRESFLKAAEFVGRSEELGRLLGALDAACEGKGSGWLIGGESGVGKSRLVDELRTFVLVRNAQVLQSRATAELARPYHIWAPLLRALAVYVGCSDDEASVLKDIVPDIASVLDRPVSDPPAILPALARQRLYETVVGVLRRHPQPLVLLLEDLQWADADSVALLNLISRHVAGRPLLLVANYRSDERRDLGESLPNLTPISLRRLGPDVVRRLVRSMLGPRGEAPGLVEFLERQTEGNAFFLVEVVRALAEDTTRLADIANLELPGRVVTGGMEEIIERRLARVPSGGLALLQLAAVCGRQIDPKVLARAGAAEGIEAWLMACANAAVIEVQEEHWLFSHDKLRERLLAMLPEGETKRLHRVIAEAIESLYGDSSEKHAALAYHFKRAGISEKSAEYFVKAANESARLFAVVDARSYYAEALEILAILPDDVENRRRRVEVALKHVAVSWYSVPPAQTLALLTEVETLLASIDPASFSPRDHTSAATVCLFRGRAIYTLGKTSPALESYRRGLDQVKKSGDLPLELLIKSSIGQSLMVVGRFREARPYLEEALDVLAKSGNWADWGRVASFLGFCLAGLGRMTEGLSIERSAMERIRELKYTTYLALQHILPAVTYLFAEDWPQMRREGRESVRIALEGKDFGVACVGLAMSEWAAIRLGDRAEADLAREEFDAIHERLGGSTLDDWHAVAAIDRALAFGTPEEALIVAERVVARSLERGNVIGEVLANRSWASALCLLKRYDEAEARLAASLRASDEAGDQLISARTHAAWAALCRARGDQGGAAHHEQSASRLVA